MHSITRIVTTFAVAVFVASTLPCFAGGTSATMQFQRIEDTASPGPFGTLSLRQDGSRQSFGIDVRKLAGSDFALFWGPDTNSVYYIAPMSLQTNGHWNLEFVGQGSAPAQITQAIPGVTDLSQMAGLWIFVATPTATTNLSDCVTNLFSGNCIIEISDGVTNLVGCVTCTTNIVVGGVLAAEVPPMTEKPFNFKGKSAMIQPSIPVDVKAKGTIRSKFTGSKGVSDLDIRGKSLAGGQTYSLWISTHAGGNAVSQLNDLTTVGSKIYYRRDTSRGEQLPLSAATVTNLSGFNIEIRDTLGVLHLSGTIP